MEQRDGAEGRGRDGAEAGGKGQEKKKQRGEEERMFAVGFVMADKMRWIWSGVSALQVEM